VVLLLQAARIAALMPPPPDCEEGSPGEIPEATSITFHDMLNRNARGEV